MLNLTNCGEIFHNHRNCQDIKMMDQPFSSLETADSLCWAPLNDPKRISKLWSNLSIYLYCYHWCLHWRPGNNTNFTHEQTYGKIKGNLLAYSFRMHWSQNRKMGSKRTFTPETNTHELQSFDILWYFSCKVIVFSLILWIRWIFGQTQTRPPGIIAGVL